MKTMYSIGIFAGTIIAIKLNVLLLLLVYVSFYSLGLEMLGLALCILLALVILKTHMQTTEEMYNHLQFNNTSLESLLEERSKKNMFLNNPLAIGFSFRIMREYKNFKETMDYLFNKILKKK